MEQDAICSQINAKSRIVYSIKQTTNNRTTPQRTLFSLSQDQLKVSAKCMPKSHHMFYSDNWHFLYLWYYSRQVSHMLAMKPLLPVLRTWLHWCDEMSCLSNSHQHKMTLYTKERCKRNMHIIIIIVLLPAAKLYALCLPAVFFASYWLTFYKTFMIIYGIGIDLI